MRRCFIGGNGFAGKDDEGGKVTAICVKQGESVLEDSPLVVVE